MKCQGVLAESFGPLLLKCEYVYILSLFVFNAIIFAFFTSSKESPCVMIVYQQNPKTIQSSVEYSIKGEQSQWKMLHKAGVYNIPHVVVVSDALTRLLCIQQA